MSGSRAASTNAQYTGLVLLAGLIGLLGAAGSIVFQAAIATAARGFGALAALFGAWGSAEPLAAPIVLAAGGVALLSSSASSRDMRSATAFRGFSRWCTSRAGA